MKIYIVEGSTGAYSDTTTWLVKAFSDKGKADLLCRELREAAEGIRNEFDEIKVDYGITDCDDNIILLNSIDSIYQFLKENDKNRS